jgi:hypothetical protein
LWRFLGHTNLLFEIMGQREKGGRIKYLQCAIQENQITEVPALWWISLQIRRAAKRKVLVLPLLHSHFHSLSVLFVLYLRTFLCQSIRRQENEKKEKILFAPFMLAFRFRSASISGESGRAMSPDMILVVREAEIIAFFISSED